MVGWRESSVCFRRPKKGLSILLIQNSEVTWIWNPEAAPFSLSWSFHCLCPFSHAALPAICHSYRWLDKDKERESAARCVFPRGLMSALDQKSWEATLALGWGEGVQGPFRQASEGGLPSHPSHSISYKTETCAQGSASPLLASSVSLLWFFFYFFI